jgi:hypothetical protein
MTSQSPFRLPVLLAGAFCVAAAPAWATFVTRSVAEADLAPAAPGDGGLLLADGAEPTEIIRSDGTIPLPRSHWGLRQAPTAASGAPIFAAVTERGPIFQTRALRSLAGAPAGAPPARTLPRYLSAATTLSARRLPIATASDAAQDRTAGAGLAQMLPGEAFEEEGVGLSSFDPRGGLAFHAGGSYESFNQTVTAGPVARWSTEFLSARSNAAQRSASVASLDPGAAGDPLLFRDVVTSGANPTTPTSPADPPAADPVVDPIPEPGTALFGLALVAVVAAGRQRRARA